MARNFYEGTDGELYTGSAHFSSTVGAAPATYGLDAGQATVYADLNVEYGGAYIEATNPDTRTQGKVAAKNAARRALVAEARKLAGIIRTHSGVTAEMLIDLGLHVRKQPAPTPAPTERPAMHLESNVEREIELSIHDAASLTKRGKPAGAVQALVYYFAGENYPSDPNGWSFAGVTTKPTFKFTVPDSVAGGTRVWLCAAWTNRAGDPGPVSVPISVNVQGGGSATAGAGLKMAA